MGQYRYMKLALTSAAALALLAGCTITPAEEGSASSAVPNNVTVQAATAGSPEKQAKDAIRAFARQTYGEDVKITVGIQGDLILIDVASPWSEASPPQDVSAATQDAATVATGVLTAVPDLEQSNVSVHVRDADRNNLIVVNSNGDVKCNVFSGIGTGEIKAPGDNPDTITLEEFNQIRTGMDYQEVFDIVGGRGEMLSEVDLGLGDEYYTAIYSWTGEGSLGANANVTFQGGKVVSKAQFGLA